MLDANALSQLKQLKQHIDDAKERATATVKGTQRRFGFAVLDDGREVFLPPEQMDKVFPGDRIEISVEQSKNGKSSAEIERLLDSPLNFFTGRYIVKGQGHFVEPDLPQLKRWIFIPPAARNKAKAGDLISCKITRHAFPQAKPQAKVLTVIGRAEDSGIEARYTIEKFSLTQQWPENWPQQLLTPDLAQLKDFSQLGFITIDSPATLDIDDALAIESTTDGWRLSVAIADPSAFIRPDSPLEKAAQQRASSIYLPGQTLPMLPPELANQHCSLIEGELRPTLICQISIATDGLITDYSLQQGRIQVEARLNYQQVCDALNGEQQTLPCQAQLEQLRAASQALLSQRQRDHLVMDDRPDYSLELDSQGKIAAIHRHNKNLAHAIVEEAMVAANRCATDFLGDDGLFISHAGFRADKRDTANKLVAQQLQHNTEQTLTLDDYITLMKKAGEFTGELPVKAILTRWLERSELSNTRRPHFGMGLTGYTTFTSPIRKYSDLLVHRLIKAKLNGETCAPLPQSLLEELQECLIKGRQASNYMERWLICQYLEGQPQQTFKGHILHVTSSGFTVRLDDSGIDGFVSTRDMKGKYSFDPVQLQLNNGQQRFQLQQAVEIAIASIDVAQRDIQFKLTEPTTAEVATVA